MPDVRSDADCRRLIAAIRRPVCRGCFTLMYTYGLRIGEAIKLPVTAVDRKQMTLRVIGKGNKERILPLTDSVLEMLEEVWESHRSPQWLFASYAIVTHLSYVKEERPDVFRTIPTRVWKREWVSFIKHYGHGNDAVLNYLSRYVLRIAISNARILAMDDTHVTFRWKDRSADAWHTMRLEGAEFLRRFLLHVLPRGFHKVRYYGLWHHSKRQLSSRAWLLLILQKPTDLQRPPKIADLTKAIGHLTLSEDCHDMGGENHDANSPSCPHCGSSRTTLLAEWPPPGMA